MSRDFIFLKVDLLLLLRCLCFPIKLDIFTQEPSSMMLFSNHLRKSYVLFFLPQVQCKEASIRTGGASKEGIDSEQHHYMTVSGSFGPGSAHILPRHPNEGNPPRQCWILSISPRLLLLLLSRHYVLKLQTKYCRDHRGLLAWAGRIISP